MKQPDSNGPRTLQVLSIVILVLLISGNVRIGSAEENRFNVLEFGAEGDGNTLDTGAIQSAIDTCHRKGGGNIVIPADRTFLTGTLRLKDGVTLHLEKGSVLRGSRDLDDYIQTRPDIPSYVIINYSDYALIQAMEASSVAIEGKGTIDGNGVGFEGSYKTRPYLLRFVRSKNVRVEGVDLKDPAFWTQIYFQCNRVHVKGVTVRSMNLHPHQPNGDGLNIDSSENVLVEHVDIQSEDDGIALKSTSPRPTKNIRIRESRIRSNVNAIKIGTETHKGVTDVLAKSIKIPFAGRSALAVESVDGAEVSEIRFDNVDIGRAGVPLFVRLGDRGRSIPTQPDPDVGSIENVTFQNITARCSGSPLPPKSMSRRLGSAISGIQGHKIQGLTFENMDLTYAGGIQDNPDKTNEPAPENRGGYPNPGMFGELPAYGLFFRHVEDVELSDVRIRFEEWDDRSTMAFRDARDVRMQNVRMQSLTSSAPPIAFLDHASGSDVEVESINNVYMYRANGRVTGGTLSSDEFRTVSVTGADQFVDVEMARLIGETSLHRDEGDRGIGHADFDRKHGTGVLRWRLNVPQSGHYQVRFRYGNGEGDRGPLGVKLDGKTEVTELEFPPTKGFDPENRKTVTVELNLSEGKHTLELVQEQEHGRGPNVDGFHLRRKN